jgi:hypothetical protein
LAVGLFFRTPILAFQTMRHLLFITLFLIAGNVASRAQNLTVKEIRSWAPERVNFESLTNNTLPASNWKRLQSEALQFVIVIATAEVTTPNKETVEVKIDYGRFSISANGESITPIGSTTPDGRARMFMGSAKG